MQENSGRTAFGRKGHNDCRSRIVFHATSFVVTETGHGLGAQISATYGTLTPIRQASQASEPNRQTTPAGSNDADSAFLLRQRVKCSQPPQLLGVGELTFTTGSVSCRGDSVRQDLPTGQLPTWVPPYMCGLEQVPRSATRRCLGGDPMRCRSIDARDARRRCPPAEARTRAAANS